jgi:general secretion pathway protein L
MNDNQAILIRLPSEVGALTSWRDGGMSANATLDEIAPRTNGRRCTVLVPGGKVLLTDASLPTRNRQRMQKAVPYALEEQLIDDVEAQHFALGSAPANSPVPVAVVAQDAMDDWLATLHQSGIRPDALLPDTLALPWEPGEWTLGIESGPDGSRWLLRCGEYRGYSIEADTGIALIGALLSEDHAVLPARLLVCGAGEPPAALLGLCAEHDIPP